MLTSYACAFFCKSPNGSMPQVGFCETVSFFMCAVLAGGSLLRGRGPSLTLDSIQDEMLEEEADSQSRWKVSCLWKSLESGEFLSPHFWKDICKHTDNRETLKYKRIATQVHMKDRCFCSPGPCLFVCLSACLFVCWTVSMFPTKLLNFSTKPGWFCPRINPINFWSGSG